MSAQGRRLHLGLFYFATGFHPAGWRLPEAKADGSFDLDFAVSVARQLEEANFDFLFLGETLTPDPRQQYQRPSQIVRFEPFTLLTTLAAATKKIGFVVTVNTTYTDPYSIARMTASLDHLSKGRLAMNIVTGFYERDVPDFGTDKRPDVNERFDRAEEYIEVAQRLWDSWEDDVYVRDKATGVFIDESKVHLLNHKGRYFEVKGPLNVLRPVQGHIPLLHAGGSPRSKTFGARYADVLFSSATVPEESLAYRAEIDSRLPGEGRAGKYMKIMPGFIPIVAKTDAEAYAKYEQMNALLVADGNVGLLSGALGCDLSNYGLDTPIDHIAVVTPFSPAGNDIVFQTKQVSGKEWPSLQDVLSYFNATRHWRFFVVPGSAKRIADTIERWFRSGAADGFIICPAFYPGGLDDFISDVVPELQRRGLFRAEHEGHTFRERFGLERPANRFAQPEIRASAAE